MSRIISLDISRVYFWKDKTLISCLEAWIPHSMEIPDLQNCIIYFTPIKMLSMEGSESKERYHTCITGHWCLINIYLYWINETFICFLCYAFRILFHFLLEIAQEANKSLINSIIKMANLQDINIYL